MTITVYQGDTKTLNFTVTSSAGVPVNLTTATIAFKIVNRRSKTAVVSLSVGSGVTVTDAAAGAFSVAITASHSANNPGSHYYEALVTISGEVSTVASGQIEFIPSPAD